MDADGMKVDELEALLDRLAADGRRPKFIYSVPSFQNPAGVTLSAERRRRLVELAREREVLVVEDNPYGLLRYEGEPQQPLYQLDGGDYVIYVGTLSKILSPGIRLGWAVRAAARDGEDRARQAGHRPLHLDPLPVLRPRVLRRGPVARLHRQPLRHLQRPDATRCSTRSSGTSPSRRSWTRPERRPVRVGDPALLHRHLGPAREGAARERCLRPRRGRVRRRRSAAATRCGSTSRAPPRRRSARASGGSAGWSASRWRSTQTITGEHRAPRPRRGAQRADPGATEPPDADVVPLRRRRAGTAR